ncbi:chromate resistance protein [Thermoplasma sp. Kam2015]|uniref:chromate resistance protein ChrB domain-containing protein n=1 Tax=Thermoplasma sp. Kam2015 TaxID=2094122 RepID=UPI000D8C1620|nr:chromate resistance protein ChrB domain-containing protein [Thermoplasma sp. Kam2015]PYB68665.1 chromate resistance protein [Thermoplasma sp. Kam2015]
MKWITRERAMVDRIACPWLIKRFIDPDAEFIYVPPQEVLKRAKELNAVPFDVENVELTHFREGNEERVSFDAFIKKYNLRDPALLELARIVRGADAKIDNPPPESPGMKALARGFREIARDDLENIKLQFPAYDALYAYCKMKVAAKNNAL